MLAETQLTGWALAGSALLLAVLLLLASAFSASEAALFSLSPIQVEQEARSQHPLRRRAGVLMRHPKRTLMKILVGATAVNSLFFVISFVLFGSLADSYGAWITPLSGVVTVLAIVIFAEILPKVIAVSDPARVAPYAAGFIHTTGYVLEPLARVIDVLLVKPVERILLAEYGESTHKGALTNAELKALLEMSRKRRVINRLEDRFVRAVLDFGLIRVRDVMIPRVQLVAYDINHDPDGLRDLIRRTKLKKIPVYDGAIDQVAGLIYAKLLFLAARERALRDLAVPVRFVPEQVTLEQLLHHFRVTRSQLAVVVDEYGGIAGLVTLEDVLEQIVGDIADEHDALRAPELRQVSDTEYEVDGQLSVHYWSELFDLPRTSERVATIGGLVTAELGRPAIAGDTVRLGNVELEVARVAGFRIERLLVRLRSPAPAAEAVSA